MKRSQVPLDLWLSLNHQFPINTRLSGEERRHPLKRSICSFILVKTVESFHVTLNCNSPLCFVNKNINKKESMKESHVEEPQLLSSVRF